MTQFKLRDLFTFICFSSPFQRFGVLCQFLIDPDFPRLCTCSMKTQSPVKKNFFLDDALRSLLSSKNSILSSVSGVFYPAASNVFAIAGGKSELRKSLILLSFLLLLFTFRSPTHISFIFLRLFLNLNLSNPAKS